MEVYLCLASIYTISISSTYLAILSNHCVVLTTVDKFLNLKHFGGSVVVSHLVSITN